MNPGLIIRVACGLGAIATAAWWWTTRTPLHEEISVVGSNLVSASRSPVMATGISDPSTSFSQVPVVSSTMTSGRSSLAAELNEADVRAALAELAPQDPGAAVECAAALPAGPLRHELLGQYLTTWAASDWKSAEDWARGEGEGPPDETVLLHLLPQWMARNPRGLVEFIEQLPEGYPQLRAVVAGRIASLDPQLALEWASEWGDGRVRQQMVLAAAATWGERAPLEAAEYFHDLPAGPLRDAGTLAVVSAWAGQDWPTASAWVAEISDARLRQHALRRLEFWADRPTR